MPTLTSDAIIASPRWGTRRRPPPSSAAGHGCGWPALDRVAGWVGGGIAAVFFASLERCSCVNVRTQGDDLLDDEHRDSEAPLMFDDGGNGNSNSGVERRGGAARRCGRGKRTGSGDF